MLHRLAKTIALLAAALLAAPALAADAYKGTIESVGKDTLVLSVNGEQHRFSVGEETTIMLNGKEAKLTELKKGHMATVTATKEGARLTATRIDAKAAAKPDSLDTAAFAEDDAGSQKGTIESVGENNLVLNANGKRHLFNVGEETTIQLNGKEAKLADLKKGQMATVTSKKVGEKFLATRIEAKAKSPN